MEFTRLTIPTVVCTVWAKERQVYIAPSYYWPSYMATGSDSTTVEATG